MSKILLIEYMGLINSNLTLYESKNGINTITLRGKIQEAEVLNGNQRVYPKHILEREIEKYIKGPVNERTAMSELDHPDSSIISLNNVSHLITKIWWEGNNVMAELELLNTPAGKIAQEIVKAGIPLGISSRGMGSVKQVNENTVEVQDDLDIIGFDLVSTPSTPNAYLRPLSEGLNRDNNKYDKINSIITEIICNQTGICCLC